MVNKITIDRATVEQALEALEARGVCMFTDDTVVDDAITALRQALQQPNEFHPDWDQIKPFHDRIAELETVAKQALGALEGVVHAHGYKGGTPVEAITALHRALEQPAQQEHSEDSLNMVKVRQIAREYAWPNSEIDAGNLYWALHVALRQLDHIGGTKEMVTEQPQQEPVAWMYTSHWKSDEIFITRYQSELTTCKADKVWPLYTHPPVIDKSAAIRIATALGWEPKREWVGLTDEEIGTLANEHLDVGDGICGRNFVIGEIEFAQAVINAYKAKQGEQT